MATPRKASKKASKTVSQSKRAGLIFPVGRIASQLRKGRYAPRVSRGGAIALAATLEYVVAEVLELAAKAVIERKKSLRVTPRVLTLAVRHDADLGALLKDVTLSRGGVVPRVEKALERKARKGGKKSSKATPKA